MKHAQGSHCSCEGIEVIPPHRGIEAYEQYLKNGVTDWRTPMREEAECARRELREAALRLAEEKLSKRDER
ncbi:MAG: hypothetical protein HY459_00980 [Parcubacteria group bacterium]|nr:hypothetical protein [Parcubacteria group bacterium]